MLTIRLSRQGRRKRPFFRIVLTEHTKPVKSGFKEVLGWYDPLRHQLSADTAKIVSWIQKGAQVSERVAKLLYNQTKDSIFQKFFSFRTRTRAPKKQEATS